MFAVGKDKVHTDRSPITKLKAWQNVALTPGRIPSFIVPPQLHLRVSPRYRKSNEDEYRLLSTSSPEELLPTSQSPVRSPRFSAKFRLTPRSNPKRCKWDMCDPSQPAMSLQHMDKVTTPYGFRMLAASPNVSRRESLFHKRTTCRQGLDSSPGSSPVFKASPKPNMATPPSTLSLETSCSPHKPDRKLHKVFNNPRAALKSLTFGRRKNTPRKV